MHTARRGAVAPALKIALAAAFALGGVGWAAWSILPKTEPTPEQVRVGPIDDAGNPVETDFTRVRSDSAVRTAMDALVGHVADAVPDIPGIDLGQAESLATAARLALEPFFSGSHNQFLDAIASLGGVVPEQDTQSRLFTRLTEIAENGSVDLSRLEVIPVDPDAQLERLTRTAVPRMIRREDAGAMPADISADLPPGLSPDAAGVTRNVNRNMTAFRPASMFPNAPTDPAAARMIDVRLPVKPRGAGPHEESIVGVRLAWVDPPGTWQPAEYRIEEITVTHTETDG